MALPRITLSAVAGWWNMQRARSFRFDQARRAQIHRRTKKDRLKEYKHESWLLVWLICNLLLFFYTGWCQHAITICYDFVESLHFSSLWVLVVDLDRSLRLYSSCTSLSWYCPTNQGWKIKAFHPYLPVTRVKSAGRIKVESSFVGHRKSKL